MKVKVYKLCQKVKGKDVVIAENVSRKFMDRVLGFKWVKDKGYFIKQSYIKNMNKCKCGVYILPAWKSCNKCSRYKPKPKKKRDCMDCGGDITHTHPQRLRCDKCKRKHQVEYLSTYKYRQKGNKVG